MLTQIYVRCRHQATMSQLIGPCENTFYDNSLAPGRFQYDITKIIFKLILVTDGYGLSSEITLRWT